MATELENVKTKIRALAAKTVQAGCTEHEAEMAMQKVSNLLSTYNLTMSDVEMHKQEFQEIQISTGGVSQGPMRGIVVALARFCDCKVWVSKQRNIKSRGVVIVPGDTKFCFFGMETDIMMVQFLYDTIFSSLNTSLKAWKATQGTGWQPRGARKIESTDFKEGYASRMYRRLDIMADERIAYEASKKTTGTSLMVIKGTLVEAALKDHILKQGFKKFRKATGKKRIVQNSDAYYSGKDAANTVNLSRPVENQGRNKLLLT